MTQTPSTVAILKELKVARTRGRTVDEVRQKLGLSRSSASARLTEMSYDQRVIASDKKRNSLSGKPSTVYFHPDYV